MSAFALLRHDPSAVFAWRAGKPVTAGEFLADAAGLAALLPERRYAVNLCTDRYRFVVAFAAALQRGQTTLMPPNQTANVLERLQQRYGETYCLTDEQVGAARAASSLTDVPEIGADQVAAILFTSGSTGEPQPHRKLWGALVSSAGAELERFSAVLPAGTTVIATVPPQHMYGLESTVLMAMQGALVLHAGRPFFPADVCAEIEAAARPRALVTTPIHLRALLDGAAAVPPVDFLLCATAPLAPQLAAEAEKRFGAPLHEIYGCTEAGQIATRRTVAGAEWHGFSQFRMRQDERGTWVSGGHVSDELLLGDVLELRDAGRFLLHGRTGDLVNIAGKRSSLASLNYHLNSIAGVRDGAFVIPQETEGATTRLTAFVVAPGLSEGEILNELRQRIDPAFLPRPLHLVEALPRNELGKLPRLAIDSLATRLTAKAG